MAFLVPTFAMFLVLGVILAAAIYLKNRTPEILHPVLLAGTIGLSLYTLYKMLPAALGAALQGVIENASSFLG